MDILEAYPINEISAPVQNGPGAYPASYTVGTGSFTGLKRPRPGVDHPPSRTEVKERVELYIYSSFGPSWAVLECTLLYTATGCPLPPGVYPIAVNKYYYYYYYYYFIQ
jgi:hypothetical protein